MWFYFSGIFGHRATSQFTFCYKFLVLFCISYERVHVLFMTSTSTLTSIHSDVQILWHFPAFVPFCLSISPFSLAAFARKNTIEKTTKTHCPKMVVPRHKFGLLSFRQHIIVFSKISQVLLIAKHFTFPYIVTG